MRKAQSIQNFIFVGTIIILFLTPFIGEVENCSQCAPFFVNISGDTMNGSLNMNGSNITNIDFLNATTINTTELHIVNTTVSNVSKTDDLYVDNMYSLSQGFIQIHDNVSMTGYNLTADNIIGVLLTDGTIIVTGGNILSPGTIGVKPNGDTGDYLEYETLGNRPRINIVGANGRMFYTSDHGGSVRTYWYEGNVNRGSLEWSKLDDVFNMYSTHGINFFMNQDVNDYIFMTTTSNVPRMGTAGDSDFQLTASSGLIDFMDDNLTTTGNLTVESIQIQGTAIAPQTLTTEGDGNKVLSLQDRSGYIVAFDGTAASVLPNLQSTEINQLTNINDVTISNAQWAYVGDMNQGVNTTDDVTFDELNVTRIISPTGNLDIDTGVTINEAGADRDTRIEGDVESDLFCIDASTGRIGYGTCAPAAYQDVDPPGDQTGYKMVSDATTYSPIALTAQNVLSNFMVSLVGNHDSATGPGLYVRVDGSGDPLVLGSESGASNYVFRVNNSGATIIGGGTATPTQELDVRGTGNFSEDLYVYGEIFYGSLTALSPGLKRSKGNYVVECTIATDRELVVEYVKHNSLTDTYSRVIERVDSNGDQNHKDCYEKYQKFEYLDFLLEHNTKIAYPGVATSLHCQNITINKTVDRVCTETLYDVTLHRDPGIRDITFDWDTKKARLK